MFIVKPTEEQIETARELAEYSVEHHPVHDIYENFHKDSFGLSGKERSKQYRFRGTLGEILFADRYGLPRPGRSFGAADGQDNGTDFVLNGKHIDVKTMRRTGHFYNPEICVFNLSKRQVMKEGSETDYYFGITLIEKDGEVTDAWFHGFIPRRDVEEKGTFYKSGSVVKNNAGRDIHHDEDTYEVLFKHFRTDIQP